MINLQRGYFYFLFTIILPFLTFASDYEILPTYHWSYEFIEDLQTRGHCLDLLRMNKPYSRGDIARSILWNQKKLTKDNDNSVIKRLLETLEQEFELEIRELTANESHDNIYFKNNIRMNIDRDKSEDFNYRGVYRSSLGVNLGKNLYAFSGVKFDQYDYYDSTYAGYKWRGIAGYTEQAYIQTKWNRIQFKIGRDFIKWGVGESGTLLFSNVCRPLDQLLASAQVGPLKFTFLCAQLDEFGPVEIDTLQMSIKRYVTAHRLDVSLWNGKLQLAISEALIYGGPAEPLNLTFLNPVIFIKGAHKNSPAQYGNILPTFDVYVQPYSNLNMYSSILIDDIQLEKTGQGDLEPNAIAWLAGVKWADPFNMIGLTFNAEYVRIANRTYKTPYPLEIFTNFNKPVGHPLGNDFDHWFFRLSYWIKKCWLSAEFSFTRNGEGSLFTPFDEPWLDYELNEGYEEPFPTGVVEKIKLFHFQSKWYYRNWLRFFNTWSYVDKSNYHHISGATEHYWEGKVRVEADLQWSWILGKEK